MASWPDTAELAQVLNVDNVGDRQTTLDRVLAAAIRRVKSDVGSWDDNVDEPTTSLAQAALRMAELMSQRPEAVVLAGSRGAQVGFTDPTYAALISGYRRRFGVA
jgi:hypothetical protein